MPTYQYKCEGGHLFDRYLKVINYRDAQTCECGLIAHKQLTVPIIFMQQDIHYESPIDGKVINSKQARLDDLARNECIEYDPGMKDDYMRRSREQEAMLEKQFDEEVEKQFAIMPARDKELIEQAVLSGADIEPIRASAPMTKEL